MQNKLVIIGDSYMASLEQRPQHHRQYQSHGPAWPSILARSLDCQLIAHGYAATSWWYSYTRFRTWIMNSPEQWHKTKYVIMGLGDGRRLKIRRDEAIDSLTESDSQRFRWLTDHWFDYWSQWHMLKEFLDLTRDKKVIFLVIWPWTGFFIPWLAKRTAVVSETMVSLCLSQFPDCHDVMDLMKHQRWFDNHFTDSVNIALAQDLHEIFCNYQIGRHNLNLEGYNLKGPWPEPGHLEKNIADWAQDCGWLGPDILL